MKTIDFLVQQLPKLGGWPDGAIGAGFLCSEGTLYFWDESEDCPSKWRIDTEAEIEDSASEVSREQYESALAASKLCVHEWIPSEGRTASGYLCRKCGDYNGPVSSLKDDADGWIDWPGGECPPVSTSTVVDVKFKNGNVQSGYPAGEYSWEHAWQGANIIAYRLHQPQEVAHTEAEQEANLNDCIGQATATEWNGEGLPPVGCECEFISNDTSWGSVIIIGFDGDKIVIKPSGEAYYGITPSERQVFRPIRSEAERKREEAVKTIMLTGWCQSAAEEIYDLIAAGKVPGIKLED